MINEILIVDDNADIRLTPPVLIPGLDAVGKIVPSIRNSAPSLAARNAPSVLCTALLISICVGIPILASQTEIESSGRCKPSASIAIVTSALSLITRRALPPVAERNLDASCINSSEGKSFSLICTISTPPDSADMTFFSSMSTPPHSLLSVTRQRHGVGK